MGELAAWIAVAVGVTASVIAWLNYRRGSGRTELSYVVTTNAALVPPRLAAELKLSHDGGVLRDPALAIVRIVSTGDLAIKANDFETALVIRFKGVAEIASAICSATRPPDLRPELEVADDSVRIKPRLINSGDMIELQVLSAGTAESVEIGGRIANLRIESLPRLPYPPGVGKEGEMVGPIDHFMWYVLMPVCIVGLGATFGFGSDGYSTATRVLILVATVIVLGAYLMRTQYLVGRRALWRPPSDDEADQ